jgi:hypothetical protein
MDLERMRQRSIDLGFFTILASLEISAAATNNEDFK